MKKIFTLLTLIFLTLPQKVSAEIIKFDEINAALGTDFKFKPVAGQTLISQLFSRGLPILIVLSGIILLIMIVMGGFTMLTNPTNPQAQEAGKNQITFAVIGFFLMFMAYWIIQILELMFGLSIV